jgi:pimeloyl-ACP methyl ester carboxylesterase
VLYAAFILLGLAVVWLAGSYISAPHNRTVTLPSDLSCEPVGFKNDSAPSIQGSLIRGEPGKGAIILMHGFRGSRTAMAEHARFLSREGFSVLFFDFRCHGESPGRQMTFGLTESKDAQAAVRFVRQHLPNERIGVLGCSLGGAAIVLSEPPLDVQACVLEMVYSEIKMAVSNRIALRLGNWGRIFSPLLTCQLYPRLGYAAERFRPVHSIKNVRCPKLIIGGSRDRHTCESETHALYGAANEPKELWIVDGAAHEDLHSFAKNIYEDRIIHFFKKHISSVGNFADKGTNFVDAH